MEGSRLPLRQWASAQSRRSFFAIDHLLRGFLDLINDADELQETQHIIGRVDLPPEETLARAVRVVVVIVVPAFTQSEDGQDETVLARLTRFIAAAAQQMAEGIDGKGRVIQDHRAQAETPEHPRPAGDQVAGDACECRRDAVIFVDEDQLRELGQILHPLRIIVTVVRGQDPAHMRPVEALLLHRMDVILLIRMLVMMAMMSRPPERALLRRHAAQKGQHKLKPAGGLEGTMREVAVIAPGDAKLADQEQPHAEQDAGQIWFHEKGGQRRQMHRKKKGGTQGKFKGGMGHSCGKEAFTCQQYAGNQPLDSVLHRR